MFIVIFTCRYKTSDRCSTQLANMIIDPRLVELTADVVGIIIRSINYVISI